MDSFRAYLDRGHADFIAHHVTTANYTYDLPFGKGRAYQLAGCGRQDPWRLASWPESSAFGTGQPYSVTFDSTMTGWPSNRADVVGNPEPGRIPRIAQWFNPAAFAVPAPFTYGNSARNMLFGPGYFNWDTAVFKNTRDHGAIEPAVPRGILQRPESSDVQSAREQHQRASQVGRITSTSNTPRDIQFGLRLSF